MIKEGEERAYNALDLKAKLEWSDETLNEKWDAGKGKRTRTLLPRTRRAIRGAHSSLVRNSCVLAGIKFGGGFYCQLMEVEKDGATTKYYTFVSGRVHGFEPA